MVCVVILSSLLLLGALPARFPALSIPPAQLNALQALYHSANGPDWIWDSEPRWTFNASAQQDPCADTSGPELEAWDKVLCNFSPQDCLNGTVACNITGLFLDSSNMRGSIPSEIGELQSLRLLDVDLNNITGSIPLSIGLLTALEMFTAVNNNLTGTIPSEISGAPLVFLKADFNRLTGSIPSSMGVMASLTYFGLSYNEISGAIPLEIGSLQMLKWAGLSSNRIEGVIPESVCLLSSLEWLEIGDNLLSGGIPPCIGLLSNIIGIELSFNFLDGHVPSTIGSLSLLRDLFLDNNLISGGIPSTLGAASGLRHLMLRGNVLSGSIPSSLGRLHGLQNLFLGKNHLSGSIPDELYPLRSLFQLHLEENHLTGTISPSVSSLSSLLVLDVTKNALGGEIPTAIFDIKSLARLMLGANRFRGRFPLQERHLARSFLETIDINTNRFSGSLPGLVFLLPNITNFIATGNCFDGELPNTICEAKSMELLALDGLSAGQCSFHYLRFPGSNLLISSGMRGEIPQCIYIMPSLVSLHLADNGLFGRLGDVSKTSRLKELVLSHNHLSGDIPDTFYNVSFDLLDLSANRVSNTLSNFLMAGDGTELVLKDNRLSGYIRDAVDGIDVINVLRGNIFSCQSTADLPRSDPNYGTAQCSSHNLDNSIILVLGVVGVVLIGLGILYLALLNDWNEFRGVLKHLRLMKKVVRDLRQDYLRYPFISHYLQLLIFACKCCIGVALFAWLVCIPMYLLLKAEDVGNYRTHSYQFSWVLTAAMITGSTSAICVIVAWAVPMTYLFYSGYRLQRTLYKADVTQKESRIGLVSVDQNSSQDGMGSSMKRSCWLCFVALINAIVVIGANSLYVYVVLIVGIPRGAVTVLQTSLALYTMLLNRLLHYVLTSLYVERFQFANQTYLLIAGFVFNSVIAPAIASLCLDPKCFEPLILPQSELSSELVLRECVSWGDGALGQCLAFEDVSFVVNHEVSFVYNYLCASSTLHSFVPVFMISMLLSCLWSIFNLLIVYLHIDLEKNTKFVRLVNMLHIYFIEADGTFFNSIEILAIVLSRLMVISSIGILCPYVAGAAAFACFILVGRVMLVLAIRKNKEEAALSTDVESKTKLDDSCGDLKGLFPLHFVFMVGVFSSVVIGIFAADTVADDDGDISVIESSAILYVCVVFVAMLFFIFWAVDNTHVGERIMRIFIKHWSRSNLEFSRYAGARSILFSTNPMFLTDDNGTMPDRMTFTEMTFARKTAGENGRAVVQSSGNVVDQSMETVSTL